MSPDVRSRMRVHGDARCDEASKRPRANRRILFVVSAKTRVSGS